MAVVVPAKAGTDTLGAGDRETCKPRVALTRSAITDGGYGSPPSRGRPVEIFRPSSSRGRLRGLRQRRKGLAFGREALQQGRRLQRGIVGFLCVIRQPIRNMLQSDLVGVVHRAAAV